MDRAPASGGGYESEQPGEAGRLRCLLLREILRGAHSYKPGLEPHRPTIAGEPAGRLATVRDRLRDAVERIAGRLGFTRLHYEPSRAASRLARVLELDEEMEAIWSRFGDTRSRHHLLALLRLRVLGPHHASLALTPQAYRQHQEEADRTMRLESDTFDVRDPFFSPLSLYRVRLPGGGHATLHSHSVDVASVFMLEQYAYNPAHRQVRVQAGDVVLDIGGCWGDTALYFASLVGSSGRVYTFEFDPENLKILHENLSLNPALASVIEVVERPLWSASGEALTFSSGGRMTTVVDQSVAGTAAPLTLSVDDFVDEAKIGRLDFIKMDVEGAEPDVLRGARETLCRHRPKLAVAAYHQDDDLVRLPAEISVAVPSYQFFLDTSSPLEDETVLFAAC